MHQVMAEDGSESWDLVDIKNLIEPFIRIHRTQLIKAVFV